LQGAGGSEGGLGRFFLGVVMLIGGFYLFFNSVMVTHRFHLGYPLFNMGGISITSGLLLIPLIIGIGIIFYNSKNPIGWLLFVAALVTITFGVLSSIEFRMNRMSLFNLMLILTLFIGGLGLFLSSLRDMGQR
jgi:hypothetical protein